ncbi:hypothetical protein [Legionella feeleii]|uniref:Uncharacterized protein n=1 Tax=Legionella feeleii TaxID=453 RepID=A0A0W0TIT5_9GAMM|nr:hypothetical protein [Legionella feeleii]KTC95508.1 hypothetical protein Lfee_3173 [Legionella feeleii]SPX60098.1 Uncharacterised protein [Legionella feeleii]
MNNFEKLSKINNTIKLSSNYSDGVCKDCSLSIRNGLDEMMNHYLQQHGYVILHIGAESERDFDHSLLTHTIVILGKNLSESQFKDSTLPPRDDVESIG